MATRKTGGLFICDKISLLIFVKTPKVFINTEGVYLWEKDAIIFDNMLKNFLMKKMLKTQLRSMPEAEQEKILKLIENNPALFETIAKEAKQKMDDGKDQISAMMEVMRDHQEELKKAIE
jgi:hypothetical protein